jgi:hypothetical protein
MSQPPPGGGRGRPSNPVATDQSDTILPFLASGGYTFWPTVPIVLTHARLGIPIEYGSYVAGDGAQLVASVFIPWGKVGFLKEVRIAPMKPSILVDVWNTTGITTTGEVPPATTELGGTYQAHRSIQTYTGLWDVPMGWESYDIDSPGALVGGYVPDPWLGQLGWQWQLTVFDGPIPQYKTESNIPPFDPLDPLSWYLTESIPVPAQVYQHGFPGRPIGVPQRMQVIPGDSLKTHAVVPSNSTICLWARWFNTLIESSESVVAGVPLFYQQTNILGAPTMYGLDEDNGPRVPVIGPSVGSLHGYTQPEASRGSNVNAVTGWGG